MLIEPLLGYKSTWRILGLLLETPRKPLSRVELFKYTKLGNAPLSRGLERLARGEIIILEKRGKKEYYYFNERNEYAQALKIIWEKEKKSLRNLPYELMIILSEFIRGVNDSCSGIEKIILFGSQAKGNASSNSDLDLAIIFKKNLEQELFVSKVVKKLEKQFKKELQVHLFTSDSFKKKNRLAEEVEREGIILTI